MVAIQLAEGRGRSRWRGQSKGNLRNTVGCHLGDRRLVRPPSYLVVGGGTRRVIMCRRQLPPVATGHDRSGLFPGRFGGEGSLSAPGPGWPFSRLDATSSVQGLTARP
jgi:hypothetical protein